MMAFSILVVASRTASNYKFGNLQLSDVIIVLALTLLLIAAVLFNVAVNHGYGNTSTAPSHRSVTASFRYSTIGYAIVIVNVVSVVLLFAQCSRVEDIFQPGAQEHCMSLDVQIDYGYFQGAFNSASDLFLAVFPIYIFWRFNWTLRVKLVLISLLSLGVVAMAASLVKTLEYPTILKSTNPRINRVPLLRWMFIEAGIVLITASVPCVRPLVIHWVRMYIRKKQTQHHQMDGEPTANQSTESFAADWKMSWIMPYVRQRGQGQASCSSEEHERQILANITTQIFAGDREFLDRHVGGIVRKVEVVVVADEIPLTTRRDSGV
ncbi:hypothetical protein BO82DRAFT_346094 [Aspergillus uvarum CBS 121591]|uniref:Rhodopsin domain-containing protein n=1 Tax=Aspergillus uvarum CBS 121591 TaxID=1448315 RepID=A0A319BZE9_9EURO|nr:hypothetical protein BO82DRAFT_346094 [Aspergillus uvarum CBS 121591]PYH76860.1 hypothetical protein BO82DRAFT_346094 [Aspergillus uvarum CBS 121591]